MRIKFELATARDAARLAALHTETAEHLTSLHGHGPWSSKTSEKGVLFAMRMSNVYVARTNGTIIATLRLTTRKPWAIDTKYYAPCKKPLYLIGMAVAPDKQRQGIGAHCLEQAEIAARAWPADAIRLDAFDAAAGAGPFYERCGYSEVGRATYRNAPLVYYQRLLPAEPGSECKDAT
jgi:GNAT superfamily N-acetyltransferase